MIRKNCTLTYPPGGCNKYKKKKIIIIIIIMIIITTIRVTLIVGLPPSLGIISSQISPNFL